MDYFKAQINDRILYQNVSYLIVEIADYSDHNVQWKEYLVESGPENFWLSFYLDKAGVLGAYEYTEVDYSNYQQDAQVFYQGEGYFLVNKGKAMPTLIFDNNDTETFKVEYFDYADNTQTKLFNVKSINGDYKFYSGIAVDLSDVQIIANREQYRYNINNGGAYNAYPNNQPPYQPSFTTTTVTEIYDEPYVGPVFYRPGFKTILVVILILFLIAALSQCGRGTTYYTSGSPNYHNDYFFSHSHYPSTRRVYTSTTVYNTTVPIVNTRTNSFGNNSNNRSYSANRSSYRSTSSTSRRSSSYRRK